jgi:hypothetical protein
MKAAQTVVGLGLVLMFPQCNSPKRIPPVEFDRCSADRGGSQSLGVAPAAPPRVGVPEEAVAVAFADGALKRA